MFKAVTDKYFREGTFESVDDTLVRDHSNES